MLLWLVSHSLWCHVLGVVAVDVSLVRSVRVSEVLCDPGCVSAFIYNVSSVFVESVSYASSRLSYVLAVSLFVV